MCYSIVHLLFHLFGYHIAELYQYWVVITKLYRYSAVITVLNFAVVYFPITQKTQRQKKKAEHFLAIFFLSSSILLLRPFISQQKKKKRKLGNLKWKQNRKQKAKKQTNKQINFWKEESIFKSKLFLFVEKKKSWKKLLLLCFFFFFIFKTLQQFFFDCSKMERKKKCVNYLAYVCVTKQQLKGNPPETTKKWEKKRERDMKRKGQKEKKSKG